MSTSGLMLVGLFLMGSLMGLFYKQIFALPEKVSNTALCYILLGFASVIAFLVAGWVGSISVFSAFVLYHVLETKKINFSFGKSKTTIPKSDSKKEADAPTSRSAESES